MAMFNKLRLNLSRLIAGAQPIQVVPTTDLISHLLPEMRETKEWISNKTEPFSPVEDTISGKIWKEIPGGHKWLDYFDVYDKEFSHFRHKRPTILEIGVYKGASLRLWKRFFGGRSTIVGVDIDPSCQAFHDPGSRVFVEIGSQDDSAFLQHVVSKYGPFDIIIDDGSHVSSHQIASFNALFLAGLKDGGIYFVEDLECIYWGHTDEFRDGPVTSVDFFKMLVDVQNRIFSNYSYNDFALHVGTALDKFDAPQIAQHIASVKFHRGIVIVEKKHQTPPRVLHI
ncbi:class I SAM-dependent methyltransferase [Brucella gallinifaecis]|uniref:class I SAM-dependent methyltransferase n=1 Tax=Brucella gallinifaecis TaxID=215590 RepID=UPI002360E600|nr:class I SAM-dependent methyltransferase [Brucella gallinifaecis]